MNNYKILFASVISLTSLGMCSCDNSVKIGPQPTPDPAPEEGTDVRMITTTTTSIRVKFRRLSCFLFFIFWVLLD